MSRNQQVVVAIAGSLLVAVIGLTSWYLTVRNAIPVAATVVQDGLSVPWDIAFTADGRMLVTERPGRIRLYASGQPGAQLLATTEVPDVRAEGEGGAMGIAVDPGQAENPWVYVCASRDLDGAAEEEPWRNQLLRFRLEGEELTFDSVLLEAGMRAHVHHNGCAVEIDAQRHIWLTMGDANTGSGANLGQDPASPNGKVLRINADGSVPDDNPVLPGASAPTAAWSTGHRNPQGLAFGPDGMLVAPEHGTDVDDELNHIARGANYGYGCFTGFGTDGPATTWCEEAEADAFVEPMWASGAPTLAVSGAAFLGEAFGEWQGDLVVTTLKEGDLRRFELDGDPLQAKLVQTLLDGEFGRLRAAVIGPDDALYLSTSNDDGNDKVIRVTLD